MIININNDIFSSFNNVVLSKVCLLIVVCLKAGSGQWINGYCHDRSMCKFLCCRNRHLPLPLLFLPILPPPRCHTSFLHDVPARTTQHNGGFGMEATGQTAPILTGMIFLATSVRHHRLSGTLPYVLLLGRAQPTIVGGGGGRKRGGNSFFSPLSRPSQRSMEIRSTGESLSTTDLTVGVSVIHKNSMFLPLSDHPSEDKISSFPPS